MEDSVHDLRAKGLSQGMPPSGSASIRRIIACPFTFNVDRVFIFAGQLLGTLSFQLLDVPDGLIGRCPDLVAKALILALDSLNAL